MGNITSYKWNRHRIHLGMGVSLGITLVGVVTAYSFGTDVNYMALLLIGVSRFLYSLCIWMLYVPVSKIFKNKLISLVALMILGVIFILPLIHYNFWVNALTNEGYPPFSDPSDKSEPEEVIFWTYIWRGLLIGLIIFIIQYREDLLQAKQDYQLANEKLQNQNLLNQLEVLKQQIDPHFLFNTLNALKTLIKSDPDKAEKYAVEISNVYRYLLRHNRSKTVVLKEELDFLYAYLSLLQLRFGPNFQVQVEIDSSLNNKLIFPLSLQLLVENAVKHNIVTKETPLQVYIYGDIDHTIITVENKLQLRSTTEGGSRYGLAHLSKLYSLHYNKEIEISSTAATFKVSLPLMG